MKEAEYILNLLEDGSVLLDQYQFLVVLGSDPSRNVAKIEQTCKQVQWHVEPTEKRLWCAVMRWMWNLYYRINQDQNLVMDLIKSGMGIRPQP